jgi:membrane-bound lytic murein transglycosylase D
LLTRGRVLRFGVLCALTALVAGCAARGTASFPGAPSEAPAPKPPPQLAPDPALDPTQQAPAPFDVSRTLDGDWDGEQIFEPPIPLIEAEAAPDIGPLPPDIAVPMNERVESSVEVLSGRLKTFLEEGLGRSAQFLPMVRDVFRSEGLPLDLAYVPLIESAFKPTALSRASARGIWQFMRATGLENGLKHDWYVDERADPEKATRAAARYLKTLNAAFEGDWQLTLASYNGGPGRVQRAVRRSGGTDFWQISSSTKYLPRETRNYVPLVLAAIVIARNPAEYGLDVQPFESPRVETVVLPSALDLRRLSAWIGTPIETIRSLNPELRQWTTPLWVTGYELKVPHGTGDILRAHLAQTDPADMTTVDWHTVTKGETLTAVGKKLKVTRTALAEANYLSTSARLQTGARLIVPRAPALTDVVPVSLKDVETASTHSATAVVAAREAPAADPVPATQVHRVKRGDTLFSIARLYRTTVAAIKDWNRLRSNLILVGQRLTIFNEAATTATH